VVLAGCAWSGSWWAGQKRRELRARTCQPSTHVHVQKQEGEPGEEALEAAGEG